MIHGALILWAVIIGQTRDETSQPSVDTRCGGHCLYVGLSALGLAPGTYDELEDSLGPPSSKGYSMLQLENEAKKRGAKTLAVETSLEQLSAREEPFVCLTLINGNHFVLIKDIDADNVRLLDPPRSTSMNRDAFRSIWDRKALLLATSPLVPEDSLRIRNGSTMLAWSIVVGILFCGAVGCTFAWRKRDSSAKVVPLCLLIALALAGCGTETEKESRITDTQVLPPAGHLEIEPAKIALGKVFRQNTNQFEHARAVLKNAGDGPLEILSSQVSCDCTSVALGTKIIPPHASTPIDVTIRLGDTTEPRSTDVRITTNDPKKPVSSLRIDWQVVNPLTTERAAIEPRPLKPGEERTLTEPVFLEGLVLCPECRVDLIAKSSQIDSRLEVETIPRAKEHGVAGSPSADRQKVGTIHLTIKPQIDPQAYRDQLILSIDCGKEERARSLLPVSWEVAPVVTVSPGRISLGSTPPNETLHQSVILRSTRAQAFRIKDVKDEDHRLAEKPTLVDQPEPVQIANLDIKAPSEPGPWRSMLRILTDHEEAEAIVIPVSGIVENVTSGQTGEGEHGK